jgi:hypothetical protein
MQIGLPGNHPMWTLQARYSPIQIGQTADCAPCRSYWWLAAAFAGGAALTWAATSKKKGKKKP